MIAQRGIVLRLPAVYLPRWPAVRLFIVSYWQTIAFVAMRHRNVALGLALAVAVLSGVIAIWAFMDHQEIKSDASLLTDAHNETVVYRRSSPAGLNVDEESSEHPYTEQLEASDELDNESLASKYPRIVEVVRYVNPDVLTEIGNVTPASADPVQKEVVKVGGFVAFRPKEDEGNADQKQSILPVQGEASIMDQVDDYLWEVYQRVPIKKDGTGDFTWKDPAAAKQMGLSLRDYVISGMDPEFREQLYHAGHAMDAAGLRWSMLSAFRDDYRQSLASGYKASVNNSLHGGSRRTGGYGHGRAIDITGPEGKESDVWKWMDVHGAKYGLHRPLPKADPAHVQQVGDWHKIALALRESRVGPETHNNKIAVALPEGGVRPTTVHKGKHSGATTRAKARKTAVASAK
jgi:hypothetical protein